MEAGEGRLWSVLSRLWKVHIIAVDAPLHPPYKGFRPVERAAMKRLGARFLPGGTPGMLKLSATGLSIKWLFYEAGKIALESHPSSQRRLAGLRVEGPSRHIVDAITLLLVAAGYATGCYTRIEAGGESMYFVKNECIRKMKIIAAGRGWGWLQVLLD